jgi:hypothetical protein
MIVETTYLPSHQRLFGHFTIVPVRARKIVWQISLGKVRETPMVVSAKSTPAQNRPSTTSRSNLQQRSMTFFSYNYVAVSPLVPVITGLQQYGAETTRRALAPTEVGLVCSIQQNSLISVPVKFTQTD